MHMTCVSPHYPVCTQEWTLLALLVPNSWFLVEQGRELRSRPCARSRDAQEGQDLAWGREFISKKV